MRCARHRALWEIETRGPRMRHQPCRSLHVHMLDSRLCADRRALPAPLRQRLRAVLSARTRHLPPHRWQLVAERGT